MTGTRGRAPAAALAVLFFVAGCGAAKMQAPGAPPTSSVDELERRLVADDALIRQKLAARAAPAPAGAEAARNLDQAQGSEGQVTTAESAPAPESAPRKPAKKSAEDRSSPGSLSGGAGRDSTCDLVCRALASMRRSATRICDIVGADAPRCTQAHDKVAAAEHRVEQAGCVCSG